MAIQSETLFTFLVLTIGCGGLLNGVHSGNANAVDELNSNDIRFGDSRETILTAKQTSWKHSNYSGCNKGHCWKWCDGVDDGKWCFTTKTYTDSYDFVPCTNDLDCDIALKCGGPCRIKSTLKKLLHHLQRLEHIKHLKNRY